MEPTSPILTGFLGSLVAGLGTLLGALPIFVRASWSKEAQRLMLAVAGGMMLGATFFSLLQPALVLVREAGGSSGSAVATVALGCSEASPSSVAPMSSSRFRTSSMPSMLHLPCPSKGPLNESRHACLDPRPRRVFARAIACTCDDLQRCCGAKRGFGG